MVDRFEFFQRPSGSGERRVETAIED